MEINKIISLRITTTVALIIFMGATNLFAQEEGEERLDTEPERHWFWDWLFDDTNPIHFDQWGEPPVVNIYEDVVMKINLSTHWKFNIGDNIKWALPTHSDQSWEHIRVPSDWENDGFNGYDGYAWYRIHFDGTVLNKNQTHFLILGFIDDVDETYINGKLIGSSGRFPPRFRTAYNSNRKYHIPAETINYKGDNVIAIRVYDEQLSGGLVSGRPGIYASQGSEDLLQDLYGQWKFKKNNESTYSQKNYDDDDWENILVPSFWDNQGYRSFDGTAWYRKYFKLNVKLELGKTYYLVLGKIDDFDITYLNGKEIGRTDDGRDFGESQSYRQIRFYEIPEGLLDKNENNVIAVKVHDLGGEGGIYKGPIGIVEESGITRILRQSNR